MVGELQLAEVEVRGSRAIAIARVLARRYGS